MAVQTVPRVMNSSLHHKAFIGMNLEFIIIIIMVERSLGFIIFIGIFGLTKYSLSSDSCLRVFLQVSVQDHPVRRCNRCNITCCKINSNFMLNHFLFISVTVQLCSDHTLFTAGLLILLLNYSGPLIQLTLLNVLSFCLRHFNE